MLTRSNEMETVGINGARYVIVVGMRLEDLDGPKGPRYLGLIPEEKLNALVSHVAAGGTLNKDMLRLMWVGDRDGFACPVPDDRIRLLDVRLDYQGLNVRLEATRGA